MLSVINQFRIWLFPTAKDRDIKGKRGEERWKTRKERERKKGKRLRSQRDSKKDESERIAGWDINRE